MDSRGGEGGRTRAGINRREFLRAGAGVLPAAALVTQAETARAATGDYRPVNLSRKEFRIMSALAEAMFPGGETHPLSAEQAATATEIDGYFGQMPARTAAGLKLLIPALEYAPRVLFFSFSKFSKLSASERIEFINQCLDHWSYWVRQAFRPLTALVHLNYYDSPQVQAQLGYAMRCRGDASHLSAVAAENAMPAPATVDVESGAPQAATDSATATEDGR